MALICCGLLSAVRVIISRQSIQSPLEMAFTTITSVWASFHKVHIASETQTSVTVLSSSSEYLCDYTYAHHTTSHFTCMWKLPDHRVPQHFVLLSVAGQHDETFSQPCSNGQRKLELLVRIFHANLTHVASHLHPAATLAVLQMLQSVDPTWKVPGFSHIGK